MSTTSAAYDVSHDPRTGEVNAELPVSTPEEVEAAVAAAAAAVDEVGATPPAVRAEWLEHVAKGLEARADELVEIAGRETGLGEPRLTGEVARAAGQLRFYGNVAAEGSYLRATLDSLTATSQALARVNVPLGPVAVFGASNFPFAFGVLGNDTGSAIAAGCPVVAKGHPAHPQLSRTLAEIAVASLASAGAPEGTFGLVTGFESGNALVTAEDVAAVAFTGSEAGGMALWRAAQQRRTVIPVFAEMGTVNTAVVTPAAAATDMAGVAEGFVGSFTLGTGQFCTKPGLLLAPRGADAPALVARALEAAAPSSPMLTSAMASACRRGVSELVDAGASVVTTVSGPGAGWSADAAVLTAPVSALEPGSRLLQECFGPVALVVEYDDVAALPGLVAKLPGALAASVLAADDDPDVASLVSALTRKVGRVVVNGWPTGVAFSWAQQHGGPWPATTVPSATSVGAAALDRFVRPVTWQGVPDHVLPPPLRADNPWGVPRRVDGRMVS